MAWREYFPVAHGIFWISHEPPLPFLLQSRIPVPSILFGVESPGNPRKTAAEGRPSGRPFSFSGKGLPRGNVCVEGNGKTAFCKETKNPEAAKSFLVKT